MDDIKDLFQCVELARNCGQYSATRLYEWIQHIVCMSTRKHLEIVKKDGEVVAFGTWVRVPRLTDEPPQYLDNIEEGDYIYGIIGCVKDGKGIRHIRRMIRSVVEKSPDAKYWVWGRGERVKLHKIRRER